MDICFNVVLFNFNFVVFDVVSVVKFDNVYYVNFMNNVGLFDFD